MASHLCTLPSLLFLTALVSSAWATKSAEIEANSISIRFDNVALMQWNKDRDDPMAAFLTAVATNVTSYCKGSDCKLGTNGTSSMAFTEADVIVMDGYPKDENADVQIVFYVSIEKQAEPVDGNKFALQKSVLAIILNNNKEEIGDAVGYLVVFVGDERVAAFLDPTLNRIMIPLSVGALVLLVLITIILSCREDNSSKAGGLTNKRTEEPPNDASEGVVLTAMNKGSSGDEDDNPSV